MQNRWEENEAPSSDDLLAECVYGSRLLGSEPDLVLHGGGNTSVKHTVRDITGDELDVLSVKGSGWDLASIEKAGFASVRLDRLRRLLHLPELSDRRMMNELRCARVDAGAPDPSVEALLHALLPATAVHHSHADAVIALSNQVDGTKAVTEAFGDRVIVVPYVMPGFDLARLCAGLWPEQANDGTWGMVLEHHGLFTVGDTTREAYTRHIELISMAERFIADRAAPAGTISPAAALPSVPAAELAGLRQRISAHAGGPVIVSRHTDDDVRAFVARDDVGRVSQEGPATPDHVIRTKRLPLLGRDVEAYADDYDAYVAHHAARARGELTGLDPAPRVLLDPELGMLTVGRRAADADIAADIYRHTMRIIDRAERMSGYQGLPAQDIFDVEYWELEQAKLTRDRRTSSFTGEVAVVTGAASGIGRACAETLIANGASVIGLDIAPTVPDTLDGPAWLGLEADVTDPGAVSTALQRGVERFGGVDILVAAAGVFAPTQPIGDLDPGHWRRSMAVNADAVADLFTQAHPLLRCAPSGGRVVLIASKNVPAPGPGAAAYSASKAAAHQLARVAALEWAADGIRVNMVHPDAVFDTGLWTDELLAQRAAHYGLTVEEYKRRNLLRAEVTGDDVASAVRELCTPAFRCTTGAQVPVDGGNDRVV